MIYIIYGPQEARNKIKLQKVIKERLEVVDEISKVTFNASEVNLDTVIDEASSLPLGYERKVIVLENAFFLAKKYDIPKEFKKEFESQYERLVRYIKSPNEETDLIFLITIDKIDEKNPIYVEVSQNGKSFEIMQIEKEQWEPYIIKYFQTNNIEIDRDAAHEINVRCKGDLTTFISEAKKLSAYTSHITFKDVDALVSRPLEDNIFDLFNYLMASKNKEAYSLFEDLKFQGVEPVTMISTLANSFRLLAQVIYLSRNKEMSQIDVANELGKKEIQIKILKRYLLSLSLTKCYEIIDTLYELDKQIKSGLVDRYYAFGLFIINFSLK